MTDDSVSSDVDISPGADSPNICPDCGGSLKQEPDELWCPTCGLIVSDEPTVASPGSIYVSSGDSTTNSSSRQVRRPAGADERAQHLTEIGNISSQGGGTVSEERRRQFARLKSQQRRAYYKSETDRTVAQAKRTIDRICGALNLTSSLEKQAVDLFTTALDEGFLNGRELDSVVGACIYAVSRVNHTVVQFHELAQVTRTDEDALISMYQTLQVRLSLPIPPRKPPELIPMIASESGLTSEHEAAAVTLLEDLNLDESNLSLSASTAAAASLSLICGGTACPRLRTLAGIASVAPETISRAKNKLKDECKVQEVDIPTVKARPIPV